jgi:hypothetical protein
LIGRCELTVQPRRQNRERAAGPFDYVHHAGERVMAVAADDKKIP